MSKDVLKIGNCQGFWGDEPHAAARLIQQQPDLHYLTLDYLAEVSMSILAIQREKDPTVGYARDFLEVIRSLIPFWKQGLKFKVVTNAGGLNPIGCSRACQEILKTAGCSNIKVGVVYGDDVLPLLRSNPQNPLFKNLESGASIEKIAKYLVTANAYLGAQPIANALLQGADVVITGRVADPSLTVGPCIAYYNWSGTDYNRIAGATIAGHLIECGTQVTGGMSTAWLDIPKPKDIGFPVVEIFEDGSCVLTKPANSGGCVSLETVKEQLLYEIGDPACYLSPDATVSFLSLKVKEIGKDRVHLSGASGTVPPPTLKVSATYHDGYRTDGTLTVFGPDAAKKARLCAEVILDHVKKGGHELQSTQIECLGSGDAVPGFEQRDPERLIECVLRVGATASSKEPLEMLSKEFAPLVTSGPQGVTGYMGGRPKVRPVFGYWPCLVDSKDVKVNQQF